MRSRREITDVVARLPRTRAAIAYARRQHAGQRRGPDGSPFIEHPVEVATLLYHAGAPDDVIAAGVLHDTLERTAAMESDLKVRFGHRVAALVSAVTEDDTIPGYARRKAALRNKVANAGDDALMVFAADKISKVRELGLGQREPTPRPRRLKHYRQCLELLEERLPDSPLVAELRAELGALPEDRKRVLATSS